MALIPLLRLSLSPLTAAPMKPSSASASASASAAANVTTRLPHPHRSATAAIPFRGRTATPPPPPPRLTISMSYNPTPATDRLIAAAAYVLPFFNGLPYGRFLLSQYPSIAVVFEPIMPLLSLYRSVPFASFVAFFSLYLAVVRNPSFSHYVRFNAMQAVVLDVLLSLPSLLLQIFNPGRSRLGYMVMVMSHNVIFTSIVVCFVYCVACSILGRTPYLPFVAEAAGRQL